MYKSVMFNIDENGNECDLYYLKTPKPEKVYVDPTTGVVGMCDHYGDKRDNFRTLTPYKNTSNSDQIDELKSLAVQILHRVEVAERGCHNTQDWYEAEANLGAPEGMSYWGWIEQAEEELIDAIESLDLK